MLLKIFTRNVQWQIVGVDQSTDERQVFGKHVLEVVGNKYSADIELDVFSGLSVVLESVAGQTFWYIKDGFERDLALSSEVNL